MYNISYLLSFSPACFLRCFRHYLIPVEHPVAAHFCSQHHQLLHFQTASQQSHLSIRQHPKNLWKTMFLNHHMEDTESVNPADQWHLLVIDEHCPLLNHCSFPTHFFDPGTCNLWTKVKKILSDTQVQRNFKTILRRKKASHKQLFSVFRTWKLSGNIFFFPKLKLKFDFKSFIKI